MSIGTQIAGYRIEALIGRGGMGVVYRAHDLALDRPVALKLLSPSLAQDPDFRERFLTESRLAASIDHPNIVPVYDAGEIEGQLYIAMRYVDGSDLKQLLQEGALEPGRAITLCSQVAAALDAAHARGLVHRDVKPSNVLVAEQDHVYLADFGLTRRLGEAGEALGAAQSLGTIDYVAPEQIRGEEVDGRADLYSLGCLLYECLTGEPPFRRTSDAATLFAHLEEEPPASAGLEQVMEKALAKDPAERYQTGGELVEAARSALGLEPRRARWPLAVALALVLVAAGLAAYFAVRSGGGPAPTGGTLVRIDPATNKIAASMGVGQRPSAVTLGAGRVWVANFGDGTVWGIDPKTLSAQKIPAGDTPTDVAVSNRIAYVANGSYGGGVTRIDTSTGGRIDSIPTGVCCPGGSMLVTPDRGGAWAVVGDGVARLSAGREPGRIVQRIRIPFPSPSDSAHFRYGESGIAIGSGALWVVGDTLDHQLWRLDMRRGQVATTVQLPFAPESVAVGPGAVWVTSEIDDVVARIDPATGRIVKTIAVGRGTGRVAVSAGSVWVASAIDHAVWRIDPRSNEVVARVRVDGNPTGVALGGGSVWVAVDAR